MPRIPASTYVTMAGLLPLCAGALGLGEIQTRSALNQPLAVEIPVLTTSPAEVAGLSVSLASPETFERYGLQRPADLGELRFTVTPSPAGGVVRISSTEAVVEPFVTLLLEVRWAQGRLLREYTVLLDPPAFAGAAIQQPVQAPQAAAPVAQPIERTAAPATPPPEPAPAAPAPRGAVTAGERTHTVARNETLWGIASQYRPGESVDMNQMMLAIYRANPDAFAGNVNRLRAGAVLRIPESGDLDQTGRSEALAEIRRQTREWQGRPAAAGEAGRLRLVPPRDTQPPVAGAAAPGTAAADGQKSVQELQSALEESRRLVAIRDAELAALQQRLAELQERTGAAEVEVTPPPGTPAEAAAPPAATAPPAETTAPAKATRPPVAATPATRAARPAAGEGSIFDTMGDLLSSLWFWLFAAAALIAALLIARRRSAVEDRTLWSPRVLGAAAGGGMAEIPEDRDDMMVVEEGGRATATGAFARTPAAAARPVPEEELPLERTISTEAPVNLDQADPLAEADFHMAYGLYDQAADLLLSAVAAEPARRDLRLKLLDVYFVWENREGFLKDARALRERVRGDADPDWKRVVFMGKQLCPDDPMFAGAVAPSVADMDLTLSGDTGVAVDLPISEESGGLDFDLGEGQTAQVTEFDTGDSTKVTRPAWATGRSGDVDRTMATPTVRATGVSPASTLETPTIEAAPPEAPTIEARYGDSGTAETPTLESPLSGSTVETPTLETWSPDAGRTARVPAAGRPEERGDQTEEIELDELGLDLAGLDEAARDMATGLQEVLPGADENLEIELGGEMPPGEAESTAEMEGLTSPPESPSLRHLKTAMQKTSSPEVTSSSVAGEDTVEQPGATGRSQVTRALGEADLQSLDLELGPGAGEEAQPTATGLRTLRSRAPEDPTMTEVGTKLDLARAYMDMGDPDGARSILNEVLEEGDTAQRQEARQLLDSLGG